MNLSLLGVRLSPVARGLMNQEYCNFFIHSASQWRVFLFMYVWISERCYHSSDYVVSNGMMIGEKLTHKFVE